MPIRQIQNPRPFWLLTGFLVVVCLTGGGARADIQSLIFIRPLAVLVFGIGLWTLSIEQVRAHRFLFGLMTAAFALVAVHLMPLPPQIWQSLPGREIITESDRLAGFGAIWRPLSVAPAETRNALFSLFVPMAVLVLAVQLNEKEKHWLCFVVLGFALLSAIIGFLQAIGPDDGPLYFYRKTNLWSSTGLFANRNHQALLLAICFPLLAVIASTWGAVRKPKLPGQVVAILAGVIIIPLLLITGSRAGIALGLIGLAAIPAHTAAGARAQRTRAKFSLSLRILGGIAVVTILTLTALVFARAEAISRLVNFNRPDEVRFNVWGPIADTAALFSPFGSGIGSFNATYRMFERASDLNYFYMNHAHNEVLEIALTGGLPAISIALAAVLGWSAVTRRAFGQGAIRSSSVCLSRLGLTILAMVALSSLVDYPLRVPSIAAIAMLAAVWAYEIYKPENGRKQNK